jgi:adenylate kinase
VIIFMGVAGSGKSMQGRLLADREGLPWLSTGEFLRMLVSGDERKDMLAGKLLDDEEIIGLVQKIFTVVDVEEEFVLDGFPRTSGQADWLLNQVKYGQLDVTAVVHLIASENAVKQRLLNRGRPDDHHEAIGERFKEYEEAIKPILTQFKSAGIPVLDVDGEQPVETVHEAIHKALQDLQKQQA